VALIVWVAMFMVLLGSFTQLSPSQKYSASVASIAGPRSASVYVDGDSVGLGRLDELAGADIARCDLEGMAAGENAGGWKSWSVRWLVSVCWR
jgi:hypothetical protein